MRPSHQSAQPSPSRASANSFTSSAASKRASASSQAPRASALRAAARSPEEGPDGATSSMKGHDRSPRARRRLRREAKGKNALGALRRGGIWPYHDGMAVSSIKSTYSLD